MARATSALVVSGQSSSVSAVACSARGAGSACTMPCLCAFLTIRWVFFATRLGFRSARGLGASLFDSTTRWALLTTPCMRLASIALACFALTWSCVLALAGEGDAAAAQITVAANDITIRCILYSPSLHSQAHKAKVAKTCVSATFERPHVCRWIMTAVWAKQAGNSAATVDFAASRRDF